jgi:hypothetical protein
VTGDDDRKMNDHRGQAFREHQVLALTISLWHVQ